MFPHEHLLVALFPILAYVGVRDRQFPTRGVVFAMVIGSQFPDLVDKPLAHQFGVLPSGRVFMHSLPFAIPIALCVVAYGWQTDRRRVAGAFVISYFLHLLGDTYHALLTGRIPPDLFWPFVTAQPRPTVPFWAGANGINIQLWTVFSAALLAVSFVVVTLDIRTQFYR